MRILLDTHAFLWFIMGSADLGAGARAAIEDQHNETLLSMASLWEIAIKVSIRKLTLSEPMETLIPAQVEQNGFAILSIKLEHVTIVSKLPFHHRDPFDRLLAAQCITEDIALVTTDSAFEKYGVRRVW
jgi:PIN domain nuclease of toxin-antitoxin system